MCRVEEGVSMTEDWFNSSTCPEGRLMGVRSEVEAPTGKSGERDVVGESRKMYFSSSSSSATRGVHEGSASKGDLKGDCRKAVSERDWEFGG